MQVRFRHLTIALAAALAALTPALGGADMRPDTCAGGGKNAFVGGGEVNIAGGTDSGVVAGAHNSSCGSYSGVVDGSNNEADGMHSVVIGGNHNSILTNKAGVGADAFIGTGQGNVTKANFAAIVAGYTNFVSGQHGFIGAGVNNGVAGDGGAVVAGNNNSANGFYAFVGSGISNAAGGFTAVVGGGASNTAPGLGGTVGGGDVNTASGFNSTVAGGYLNIAHGAGSFAAGRGAQAIDDGTFVWSDQVAGPAVRSTGVGQFIARAAGGVAFYSSVNLSTGVKLHPGSGAWSDLSDRSVKTAIVPVDAAAILAKVVTLPVSEWSYTAQGSGIRHLGPMAQDFKSAFGIGEDDRHITTIDESGVALAAIKGLHAENEELRARLARQDAQIAALRDDVARLAGDREIKP